MHLLRVLALAGGFKSSQNSPYTSTDTSFTLPNNSTAYIYGPTTYQNVTLNFTNSINASVTTVNADTLLQNNATLPINVTVPTIITMNSTVSQNVSDAIFINLIPSNDSSAVDVSQPSTGVSIQAATALPVPSPYTYTGWYPNVNPTIKMSYIERTVWFLINAVRLSYSGYVSLFAGATASNNPIATSCAATAASVSPLMWGVELQLASTAHLKDMVSLNCFQHDTCNKTLCTQYGSCSYASRMASFYSKALLCGENVAVGFSTPQSVMMAYLNSPGHCSNIMYPGFKEVGSAVLGNWWGNDFGGGPTDSKSALVMGTHFVNRDGSITFYLIIHNPSTQIPATAPITCVQGNQCNSMTRVPEFSKTPAYSTIYSYVLSAAGVSKLQSCISYVFYAFIDNKSYQKFPQTGYYYATGNKGCTLEFFQ